MSLKERLHSRPILLAPGVYDGLSACMAERAGAEALYLSGASFVYTRLGRPDIGLAGLTEVVETTALIRDRVALPLIVDADTGFGNALNVERTVRMLERAGANAIQIEDQTSPKRCGHLAGKSVIAAREMVGKVQAACAARTSAETLIIARTDALAIEGLDAALERAARYAEAGADLLFVEALRSDADMARAVAELGGKSRLMINMVEGGKTPMSDTATLERLGFSLVIFPGGLVRAVARTMQDYFESLMAHGSTAAFRDRMFDFDQLQDLVGLPELLARGARYDGDGSGGKP